MEVIFLNTFKNDLKKLQEKDLMKKLKDVIVKMEESNSILEISNIKKIKGSNSAYRLRINDYRLGFYYENGIVELCCFVHRKDIYKLFP